MTSGAMRRYRRWERTARAEAREDARQLAIDLYEGRTGPVSPYGMGVILEPDEVIFRQVWARYATLAETPDLYDAYGGVRPGSSWWREWGWTETLLTSHRLVSRLATDGGRLVSLWWSDIAGVQVDLAHEVVALDASAGQWRGCFKGPMAAVVAVAAVERVYGPRALLDHPGLASLRDQASSRRRQPSSALSRDELCAGTGHSTW